MATTREEALQAGGRFGKVRAPGQAYGFYGQCVDVHPGGDYLKFQRRPAGRFQPRWYHRDHVTLHPVATAATQAPGTGPVSDPARTERALCTWSADTPDACPYCSGEACNLCGAGCWSHVRDCAHDSFDRHAAPGHDNR